MMSNLGFVIFGLIICLYSFLYFYFWKKRLKRLKQERDLLYKIKEIMYNNDMRFKNKAGAYEILSLCKEYNEKNDSDYIRGIQMIIGNIVWRMENTNVK